MSLIPPCWKLDPTDSCGSGDREETSEEQENPHHYCQGGYHPVEIGDVFCYQYRVVRKLGWGYFSTVWLCWDIQKYQYVAIKVTKSKYSSQATNEIKFLNLVKDADNNHLGRERTVYLLDHFNITGPNGTHVCTVMEVMGRNLSKFVLRSKGEGMPLANVKTIMRQVLQSLDYLHTRCKIIHTDLKPDNILMHVNYGSIEKMVEQISDWKKSGVQMPPSAVCNLPKNLPESLAKMEITGKGDESVGCATTGGTGTLQSKNDLKKIRGDPAAFFGLYRSPVRISSPTAYGGPDPMKEVFDFKVKVADFGNACLTDEHISSNIQTLQYRSFEATIGAEYDTPVDIWSAACIAFELATGSYLFNPASGESFTLREHHLSLMIRFLGPIIPTKISKSGKQSHLYFDISGRLKHFQSIEYWPISRILLETYGWTEKNATEFSNFLMPMFAYNPSIRATAAQCLRHPWLSS